MKTYHYACLFLFFALASCQPQEQKLVIATAANMQFALQPLCEAFTAESGVACDLIISSSGKLTAQIQEGAPYDVFMAANMKYPNQLFKKGLTTQPPRVYAYGKLVLWTFDEIQTPSLDILKDPSVRHIALANPKTAPYGAAAMDVLQHYGLLDQLQSKLVYGESIAQTNQFITSRSADLGFTAMSVVRSPKMKNQGKWIELDEKKYQAIEQGIVLIKHKNKDNQSAQLFYNFLFSDKAKKILKDFGYSMNE